MSDRYKEPIMRIYDAHRDLHHNMHTCPEAEWIGCLIACMEREPSDAAIEPYRQALGELRADFHRIVQIAAQHDAEAGQVKLPGGSDE